MITHLYNFNDLGRWTRNIFEHHQQSGARHHVFLLHGSRDGTRIPKVHMVEETSDHIAIGKTAE